MIENLDMIKRVDDLKEKNNVYENTTMDLAKSENEIRDQLIASGINKKEIIDDLADKFSTEILKRMEAEKEKYKDVLTGFENRAALLESLPKLLSFEKRNDKDCSVLMIDLDYFKSVNDTYGHDIGDEVLIAVSHKIKECLRESDFSFRYGGEEFVVFLMDSDMNNAKIVAEKIRKAVENMDIKFQDNKGIDTTLKKTLSLGYVDTQSIGSWSDSNENFDSVEAMKELIKKSDEALYIAKETGRNRIVPYNKNLKDVKGIIQNKAKS